MLENQKSVDSIKMNFKERNVNSIELVRCRYQRRGFVLAVLNLGVLIVLTRELRTSKDTAVY